MDLEPAERNPAQLRKTALTLVAIMIVGATFVLYAYVQHERSKDPNRPPRITKLKQHFGAKNQEDKLIDLLSLKGKFWFAAPISVTQLDENKYAIEALKKIAARYPDRKDMHFVLISIEGTDQGVDPAKLTEAAKKLGIDQDPRWWLLTTGDTKKQRGYLKDHLRLGLVLAREEGDPAGKWKFPSEIAFFDSELHLRGRYDFKDAHNAAAKHRLMIQENPGLKDDENIGAYLEAVERLYKTLFIHIDYVTKEKN